ncbi:MAG: hypothetical protein EA377_11630 [Phycisphaerales bacterium]|nr:MAG: hypothetical protein EA377_11630 [Phycisphaerales bacterium]
MVTALQTCWDIGESSFLTLIESSARSRFHTTAASVKVGNNAEPMPCDELLPSADRVMTWRVSIDALPSRIWPWLCQMMRGGGMYGMESLESPAQHSSPRLLHDIPAPREGDALGELLHVALVKPGSVIVWKSSGPLSLMNHKINELTLAYRLTAEQSGRSVLQARLRCRFALTTQQVSRYLCQLIGLMLPASQLKRIKQLAVAHDNGIHESAVGSQHETYQALAFQPARNGDAPERNVPTE